MVTATSQRRQTFTPISITAPSSHPLMQCSVVWGSVLPNVLPITVKGERENLTENSARDRMRREKDRKKPANTRFTGFEWRSGWDSNPRNLAVQLISSQSRYDHFDTAPRFISTSAPRKTGRTDGEFRVSPVMTTSIPLQDLSQHQHLGKRGELMGRTKKNIKL